MLINEILSDIDQIKNSVNIKVAQRFKLDQTRRMLLRMNDFEDCMECGKLVNAVGQVVMEIKNSKPDAHRKKYKNIIGQTLKHLKKEHNLVTKGYYTGVYMVLGIAFGLILGMAFAQFLDQSAYTGIGLPLGLAVGLAIGSGKDTKAREEERVI